MLGQILQIAIKSAGITAAEAASYMGVSEANLYKLYKKSSFEVSYLVKAAELLKLPIAYFLGTEKDAANYQVGDFNQSTSNHNQNVRGNNQTIKGNNDSTNNLTLDSCKQSLKEAEREVEFLKGQLARADALVEAKDMTITLLRAKFDRPN